jgi:large conductance mechanosensitive channel
MAVIRGFRAFLLRGNVIDLATAVVIGAAFNSLVMALVRDFVTPLIAMFGGKRDYSELRFVIRGTDFYAGDFLNVAISFLIVSATLYFFVVMPFNRLAERFMPQPQPAPMRECPYCLANVPKAASKCMYCTSDLRLAA